MNAFWDAYWPGLVTAAVLGVLFGSVAFRPAAKRRPRTIAFRKRAAVVVAIGAAIALAAAALWHGPAGTGERFAGSLEQQAREVLVNYEMTQIRARVEREPLRRSIVLAGPADDFQREQLVVIMNLVPGVERTRWVDMRSGSPLPLFAEAELASLVFFALGLLLAYLLELRRRYRAQWSW